MKVYAFWSTVIYLVKVKKTLYLSPIKVSSQVLLLKLLVLHVGGGEAKKDAKFLHLKVLIWTSKEKHLGLNNKNLKIVFRHLFLVKSVISYQK